MTKIHRKEFYTHDGVKATIFYPEDNAGRYIINSTVHLAVRTKPCWFQRLFVRLLLGWKWEDYK